MIWHLSFSDFSPRALMKHHLNLNRPIFKLKRQINKSVLGKSHNRHNNLTTNKGDTNENSNDLRTTGCYDLCGRL